MKRSSCLSALLVGLSVMTASVAFAAPPSGSTGAAPTRVAQAKGKAKPKAKPKTAAAAAAATEEKASEDKAKPSTDDKPGLSTVQPTDPPPEGGTPAPAPAVAEPAAAEPAAVAPAATEGDATPAITIGTGTTVPGADTPPGAAGDPAKKPKPRPWAGTQIFAQTSMNTNTIFRGQTQYANPTVDSFVALSPRYAINDAFQLRGRLTFAYEWTNSDSTTTKNEPRFGDTLLQLFYRKIPTLPGGINMAAALNAGLPTSSESRARTLVVAPGATLQFVKSVEHVIGGELLFLASTAYSHPLYRSTTPEIRGTAPYAFQCAGGNACSDQLSGVFNPSDTLSYTALVAGEWGKWSPALFYLGGSQWAYTGKEVANPVDGTPLQSAQGRPTNVRQSSYFAAWLDYNANSWFTAEVGYSLFRAALDEDGSRGNPFFGRYQDMRVYLGANFNIDNLLKQLEGGATEAGIVRAKNMKQPFRQF